MSGDKHLSTAADQELADDQLPAGHTPVWIEPPRDATQVQMLERVETMARKYQDVMVLYPHGRDERAATWCKERGWKYHRPYNIYGCEAQCVVLLDCLLHSEFLTRARNMLIILNNKENTEKLQTAVAHSDDKYQCKMSDCSYTGTTLINNIPWAGEAVETKEEDQAEVSDTNREEDRGEEIIIEEPEPQEMVENWEMAVKEEESEEEKEERELSQTVAASISLGDQEDEELEQAGAENSAGPPPKKRKISGSI